MKLIVGCIVGAFINGVFWFLYSMTGNIVPSMGIIAVVCIGIIATLKTLGKRKLK